MKYYHSILPYHLQRKDDDWSVDSHYDLEIHLFQNCQHFILFEVNQHISIFISVTVKSSMQDPFSRKSIS